MRTVITLRIKKVYFDAIADRSKRYEYRSDSEFYRKMFIDRKAIKSVMFHYQSKERLTCQIKSIRLVKNVDETFFSTDKVFRLELTKPKRWIKE